MSGNLPSLCWLVVHRYHGGAAIYHHSFIQLRKNAAETAAVHAPTLHSITNTFIKKLEAAFFDHYTETSEEFEKFLNSSIFYTVHLHTYGSRDKAVAYKAQSETFQRQIIRNV